MGSIGPGNVGTGALAALAFDLLGLLLCAGGAALHWRAARSGEVLRAGTYFAGGSTLGLAGVLVACGVSLAGVLLFAVVAYMIAQMLRPLSPSEHFQAPVFAGGLAGMFVANVFAGQQATLAAALATVFWILGFLGLKIALRSVD